MAAIETRSLTKRFGDVVAVRDLDLTVEEGEVYGFLGPNGAGKSTTINLLLDFMRPSEGSATVLGHDAQAESRTVRERIGILPEGFSLYDRLTGREHLSFTVDAKDADDDPDALLEQVGLSAEDAERRVGGYSKGMTQRLALGCALVGDPDLLILDEPSSGLDPNGVSEMRDIIRSQADRGTAVFFSSHILSQVEAVCDRVAIMQAGELVAVDTIDGLRQANGGGARMTLTVDAVPDLDFTDVPGVTDATVDGNRITLSLADDGAKAPAINHVENAGVRLTDIETSESSLEDLFTTYTSGSDARRVEEEVDA